MGVHGLWTLLEPCHRPTRLETLARKRLAVDASIWIYQFLKAVRDAEGNALNNSHIVGFFRRICKLLFHGIRPVFVFDGGAPALKRATISGRRMRREGRREDSTVTARRLLTLQMRRAAEIEVKRQRRTTTTTTTREEEFVPDSEVLEDPEEFVYVDELEQTEEQRKQNKKNRPGSSGGAKKYRKTDEYQLPELEQDFSEIGRKDDVRMLTAEELQAYAQEYEGDDAMRSEHFSNTGEIDFSGSFFQSLPIADRYRLLAAARAKSRWRMGYTKEELDNMFPDRMAFSRFQIERVARRNELSQRLMNIQGRNDGVTVMRVAGEKGREYVLVRNEENGGWMMSFVGQKGDVEGDKSRPVDLEKSEEKEEPPDSDEDADFEDVPIPGLNRLPLVPKNVPTSLSALEGQEARDLRRAIYESKLQQSGQTKVPVIANGSLFLGDEPDILGDELLDKDEDWGMDQELQDAITRSLGGGFQLVDNADEDLQRALAMSMGGGGGGGDKGKGLELVIEEDDENDDADFQAAVADSLRSKTADGRLGESSGTSSSSSGKPLPFSLDLSKGSSFLMNKKLKGGPLKNSKETSDKEEEPKRPIPPWFVGVQKTSIASDMEKARKKAREDQRELEQFMATQPGPRPQGEAVEVLEIEEDDNDSDVVEVVDIPINNKNSKEKDRQGTKVKIDDVADRLRELPPTLHDDNPNAKEPTRKPEEAAADSDDDDDEIEWQEVGNTKANSPPKDLPVAEPALDQRPPPPSLLLAGAEETSIPSPAKSIPSKTTDNGPSSPPPPLEEEPDDLDLSFELDFDAPTPPPEEIPLDEADEVAMLKDMAAEVMEHDRFAAEISHQQTTTERLLDYEREMAALRKQQKADRRDADEVTQSMVSEVQALLKLFGLPYITAPMEAEAQCAELVKLGLVDGIVTDDSDVFLFGGTRVYRYMFNDKHSVQCYLAADLEKELSLSQSRLISTAHLLGSDYTDGIPGVGPITAVELLADHSGSLSAFATWWKGVEAGTDDSPHPPPPKSFRAKFKKQHLGKLILPPSFPSHEVDEAYLNPQVDSDATAFEWGSPDLDGLRKYLMALLGWTSEKTDQVLVPVVRDMNRRLEEGGQSNITNFFDGAVGSGAWAPRVRGEVGKGGTKKGKSKRLEKAIAGLRAGENGDGGILQETETETETETGAETEVGKTTGSINGKRKIMSMSEVAAAMAGGEEDDDDDDDEVQEVVEVPQKKKRKTTVGRGRGRGRGRGGRKKKA